MKKLILLSGLLLIMTMAGCTVDDPGHVIIDDTVPVDVAVTGNPEVKVVDSDGDIITIDEDTRALVAIEFPHHEVHEGCAFKSDINSDDIDSEGNNNALHISFTTSNTTKWVHLIVYASVSGSADLSITEAPTGGVAGGSNLSIYNRERNSTATSGVISTDDTTVNQMTQDATAPTGGTVIHHWKLGAGKNKIGGDQRGNEEFILRQNTTYSIRLTANANDIRGQLTLEWYEHTNEE